MLDSIDPLSIFKYIYIYMNTRKTYVVPDCSVVCHLIYTYIQAQRGFRNEHHWFALGRTNASGVE